jgi:putative membrane protein
MWHMHDGMGWWMIFSMILFWGVIVALVIWGIRRLTERGRPESDTSEKRDPLYIAKQRYALGEISREEFDRIKNDLS